MLRIDPFEREASEFHVHHDPQYNPEYPACTTSRVTQTPYAAAETPLEDHTSKKRRIDRACDFCRRRKTKCDGPQMPANVCTNCIQTGRSCTYVESSKPRGPPKAYVVALEDRMEKMEALFRRLRPEADFSEEIGPAIVRDSWKSDFVEAPEVLPSGRGESSNVSSSSHSLLPLAATIPRPGSPAESVSHAGFSHSSPPFPVARRARRPKSEKQCPLVDPQMIYSTDDPSSTSSLSGSEDEESSVELSLVQGITQLTLRGLRPTNVESKQIVDGQWRFHGKSSSFKLISTARELKQRHMDEVSGTSSMPASPARSSPEQYRLDFAPRRSQYWDSLPWEISFEGADRSVTPPFIMSYFPALDLAEALIDLYFIRTNSLFPLLHRPTFQKQWNAGLYKSDIWFACVCMAMFAVASRWGNDPRVLPDGVPPCAPDGSSNGAWALTGWKYVNVALDVHRRRRSLFLPPNLFEIQTFVLMAMYFRGTIAHAESWTFISIGIRKAQDVGVHRRKVYGQKPTIEEELWKRTIWHLIAMDRIGSLLMGRPCCSRDEDFDLDLPLEVDDEYWDNDNSDLAFQQPLGRPACITAFVYWVKLSQISAFVLRTLYAIGRFKQPLGLVGPRWKEQVIERLNKALLEWIESLPPHLRWSSDMGDDVFASQSAILYLSYYIVQITIYRPFIPSPRVRMSSDPTHQGQDGVEGSLAALAICTSAAKAGTRILEVLLLRSLPRHTVVVHYSFVLAGVLLVNLWTQISRDIEHNGRESGDSSILEEQSKDLFSLLGMLNNMRPRWELAREAFDDIMQALPPSLLPVAMARFEHSPEDGQAVENPPVVHSTDSGPDNPPFRFFYPSPGPSSYRFAGEDAQPSPPATSHRETAYPSNPQPEPREALPVHRDAWPIPAYAMSAYGQSFAVPPQASVPGQHQRIQMHHELRSYNQSIHTGGSRHDPVSVHTSHGSIVPQTSSAIADMTGGYAEHPYIKVERNDDIPSSQVLWRNGGQYQAPPGIRRYPGSRDEGQHGHHPPGHHETQWRRWDNGNVQWSS